MEIKTVDGVKNWLKENKFLNLDEIGFYVTHGKLTRRNNMIYTGPPMLLVGDEYKPYKLYLENGDLEGMIEEFLVKGKSSKKFPFEFRMENGADAGSGYTNHLSDFYVGNYTGHVLATLEKLKTGDINYSAEIDGYLPYGWQ